MTNTLPLYKARYRNPKDLVIEPLSPARGTETRPQKRWRDPHSSLAVMSVSPRASLLRAAREGDDKAAEWLANSIAEEAYEHAWHIKDKVCVERGPEFVARLVKIALYRSIHGEHLPQREAAERLGITQGPYQRNWLPRISGIYDTWCKRLVDELEGV